MPNTTECKLEYWNPSSGSWVVGHAGVGLLHPRRYCERLELNGKIGRVTILETGEVIQTVAVADVTRCDLCGDKHAAPYNGECLL